MTAPSHATRCLRHADRAAVTLCERCGDATCFECSSYDVKGASFCPACQPLAPLPLASLWSRFGGQACDSLLFGVGIFLAGELAKIARMPMLALLLAAALGGINLFMIHRQGQSFGKILASTRVVTVRDERVAIWRVALLRWPVSWLGLLDALFLLGESRRALHDLAAGTRVVAAEGSEHVYAQKPR
ncbi:MAG: hypothetical protein JWN48_657 [Myxococcaceae bacterium]|nr:hypothetical protein [Myxococcaceae bacterium]